jgi:hypothetical protein
MLAGTHASHEQVRRGADPDEHDAQVPVERRAPRSTRLIARKLGLGSGVGIVIANMIGADPRAGDGGTRVPSRCVGPRSSRLVYGRRGATSQARASRPTNSRHVRGYSWGAGEDVVVQHKI